MKVILKQEVDNVGLAGDIVDVADGYGRNYLLPRGMAIRATKGAMREAEALTRSRKAAEAETLDSALAARETLESRTLEIPARVDERGHLYGSVSVNDVHRVLRERGHQIEKKRIDLKGTIKEIGTYEVPIQVHPQVEALVTVDVTDVEGEVIAGQISEPEIPPLPGEVAEAAPEGEELPADEEAAADVQPADPAEEPQIDSVEDLVEQALEAAEEYESDEDEGEDTEAATSNDETAEA